MWVMRIGGLVALLAGCNASPAVVCPHRVTIEIKRVEDGSELMQQIHRSVASSGAAGVTAEIDEWVWDDIAPDGLPRDTRRFTDHYLRANDRGALQRFLAELERKDPTLKPDAHHQILYEHVTQKADSPPHWRTYYVASRKLLTDGVVVGAEPVENPLTGRPTVKLLLTADGAAQLTDASRANAGHKLAAVVDGVVWSAPIVNGPIKSDSFTVTAESDDAVRSVVERLRCPK